MADDPSYTYSGVNERASDPSDNPVTITPHDVNAVDPLPRAIYVGTGGNITLRGAGGTADVVLKNVASGSTLAVRAKYIRATGTTAADIVGLT